jgi:hypothetical protein
MGTTLTENPWASIGLTPERVDSICNKAVAIHANFFKQFPDISWSDLMQDCRLGVWQSIQSKDRQRRVGGHLPSQKVGYDGQSMAATTWVFRVAMRRMKDRVKVLGRRMRKEDAYKTEVRKFWDSDEHLVEWLDDIYHRAKYAIDRYCPSSRNAKARSDYSDLAQATAMLALQHKLGYSTHQMAAFMAERPALLKVVGLPASPAPSAMFFSRCKTRVTQINFSDKKAAVE